MPRISENRPRRTFLFFIYGGAFAFFVAKALFYANYVGRFPDELNHISYIAFLEKTHALIPDFKSMTGLVLQHGAGGDTYQGQYVFGTAVNQLGHPPLYYQIMRLSGGVVLQGGTVVIHIVRLRLFSLALASLGLLLAFYIGWSRIARLPALHLLYAALCVSVPMFAYVSASVNNDTMSYISVNIYLLGVLRFSERRTNGWTYLLVSLGITMSLLSKMTAGLVVAGSFVLYLLYLRVFSKDLHFFRRRAFWATVPVYLACALYFIAVKRQTGSFQPTLRGLNLQQFQASGFYVDPAHRMRMDFQAYAIYFFKNFALTWSGIASYVSLLKGDRLWSLNQIGLLLFAVLPLLSLLWRPYAPDARRRASAALSIYFSLLAVLLIQFFRAYWEFEYISGYSGGYQSRYYLCAVPALALCIVWGVQGLHLRLTVRHALRHPGAEGKAVRPAGNTAVQLACVAFTGLLVYEDMIYFLIHFDDYL